MRPCAFICFLLSRDPDKALKHTSFDILKPTHAWFKKTMHSRACRCPLRKKFNTICEGSSVYLWKGCGKQDIYCLLYLVSHVSRVGPGNLD